MGNLKPVKNGIDLLEVYLTTNLEINLFFTKVKTVEPLINVSNHEVKDLSTDQYYSYQIVKPIRSGHIHQKLKLLKLALLT